MSGFRRTGKYKYSVGLHNGNPAISIRFLEAESADHAQKILLKHFEQAIAEHDIVDDGQFGFIKVEREMIKKGWRKCFTLIDTDGNWYCGIIHEDDIWEEF